MDTVAGLPNSIRTQYIEDYLDAAMGMRLFDQIAYPVGKNMEELKRGSSVQVPFLSHMSPGVTAIPETTDITPQQLNDAVASIAPTSRGEALQASEKLLIQAYTDYGQKMHQRVGENAMESIEILANAAATQGALVSRGAIRGSIDAGTSGHRASDAIFAKMQAKLLNLRAPGLKAQDGGEVYTAFMHPHVFHDIREGGNVDSIGLYQDKGIHLNWELGQIGCFRLVVSPWVKTFFGAGAANATDVDTTLAAAATKLSKTIVVAADTNIDAGQVLNLITAKESGDTHYPDNEQVEVAGIAGTTVTIVGQGENGGLRYDHPVGTIVNRDDSVYPIVFGGKESLAKLWATEIGEFGQVLPPERIGLLKHIVSLGWKWYGGYGRIAENRLIRGEYSVSAEA